jgi:hypothetical protein
VRLRDAVDIHAQVGLGVRRTRAHDERDRGTGVRLFDEFRGDDFAARRSGDSAPSVDEE